MIRTISLAIVVLLIGFAVNSPAQAAQPTSNASLQPLDKILAVVNNDVVTQGDLDERIKVIKQQLRRSQTKIPSESSLRKQALQQMIDQTLQLQVAEKLNITVDNESLNYAVNDIATKNNMTLAEFKQQLSKDGISYRDFRKEVRDELIISRVQEREVKPKIVVTTQEVDNFLRAFQQAEKQNLEYRLENITISLPDSPTPDQVQQTRAKAMAILAQLRNGADFEATASAQSSGEYALSGGDLGWRSLARLPTVFAEKAQHMKRGEIAGPIRTGNGFHIIKLVDKRGNNGADGGHKITENKVRHILIKIDPMTTEKQAKAKIESLRKQITNGASFATVAKKYSDDPGSASKGGELGWVVDSDLVPAFAKAMDSLKVNQLSQPVKTQFGWHLILVEARKQKDITQQEKRQKIQNLIGQRKYEEAIMVWIRQLRAQSYVKDLS